MYTSFYELSKMPFDITPDPEFLYPGELHKEAFASVLYGLKSHKGIVSLIGEVGTGKTVTLRSLMKSAQLEEFHIVYLFNPNMPPREFIAKLLTELNCPHDPELSLNACIDLLADKTLELYRQNSGLIIIIDEAQHVPDETLEFVRLLSNIESDTRKLVQILLAGQPELLIKLQQPHMRQLRQRIVVSAKLAPMSAEQTGHYIEHRLRASGAKYMPFDSQSIRRIVEATRGNPRLVNIVCDMCLVNGMGYGKKQIDVEIVGEVLGDLESTTLAGVVEKTPTPAQKKGSSKKDRVRRRRPVKALRAVPANKKNASSHSINTSSKRSVANVGYLQNLTSRTAYTTARQTPSGAVSIEADENNNENPYSPVLSSGTKDSAATGAGEQRRFWSWLKTGASGQ